MAQQEKSEKTRTPKRRKLVEGEDMAQCAASSRYVPAAESRVWGEEAAASPLEGRAALGPPNWAGTAAAVR
jgi:hypothetical protein